MTILDNQIRSSASKINMTQDHQEEYKRTNLRSFVKQDISDQRLYLHERRSFAKWVGFWFASLLIKETM